MTVVTENGTKVPVLYVGNLTDLHDRTGNAVRNGAAGAVQLFDDGSARQRALLVLGPPFMDRVLRFLGIDPATIPDPGTTRDVI